MRRALRILETSRSRAVFLCRIAGKAAVAAATTAGLLAVRLGADRLELNIR